MYICSLVRLTFTFVDTRVKGYKTLYYKDPLMDFIYVWFNDRYKSKVLLSATPILGPDLEVKVKDLEFSYKSQIFYF